MGKLNIVTRLADRLGTTVAKAQKFVDDLGAQRASRVADEAGEAGGRTVSDFITPGTLAVGGIGGGALLWRQQDVATAQALAEQEQSYSDAVQSIMNSNMPAELKQELVDDVTSATNDSEDDDGGGPFDDLLGDPMTMILVIVIVSVVLRETLGGDE